MKFIPVMVYSLNGFLAWSEEKKTVDPLPSAPPPAEAFLVYKSTASEKSDTYQFLNKQDKPNPDRDTNVRNFQIGKSRAQQMVEMLQNQELTRAFQKVTKSGYKTLEENPEIGTPLIVIAGAASLWYGRTIKLIRGNDYNLSARMEGRAQRSEFSMGSPLLNGKFQYGAKEGVGVGVNRNIAFIQTDAAFIYNARQNLFSTEVRKSISPNIDLSFGVNRLDQNTKIEYRLNF